MGNEKDKIVFIKKENEEVKEERTIKDVMQSLIERIGSANREFIIR